MYLIANGKVFEVLFLPAKRLEHKVVIWLMIGLGALLGVAMKFGRIKHRAKTRQAQQQREQLVLENGFIAVVAQIMQETPPSQVKLSMNDFGTYEIRVVWGMVELSIHLGKSIWLKPGNLTFPINRAYVDAPGPEQLRYQLGLQIARQGADN